MINDELTAFVPCGAAGLTAGPKRPPPPRIARRLRHAASRGRANLDRTFACYRYGAGAAFDSLRQRTQPHSSELLAFAGAGGRFGALGGNDGGGHGGDGGDDDEDNDIPSWGAAPGAHVIMRGRSDEAYRNAVAHLMMLAGHALPSTPPAALVKAFTGADPKVPLVIMLSWMGASPRAVARYKSFYEELGYEVHVVFNGLKTAVFPPASKKQAHHIRDVIEVQHPDRPVFVHAFSIGTGIYGLFLDALKHDQERRDRVMASVTGVIFDSGPAPIFPHDVAKGLHTVCPPIPKPVWEVAARLFFFVTQARKSFEKGEAALRGFQMPSPQLYFYSKDDKVIPDIHHAVEEFIEKNKQRGIEVYNTFWDKSVHATHLKMHPEEYIHNLENFVKRCMDRRTQGLLTAK